MSDFFAKLNKVTDRRPSRPSRPEATFARAPPRSDRPFTHSINVKLITGVNKGYTGTVVDTGAAYFSATITDTEYRQKGTRSASDVYVIGEVPQLYTIDTNKGILNMPVEAIEQIVLYNRKDVFYLGKIDTVETETGVARVFPIEKDDMLLKMSQLDWAEYDMDTSAPEADHETLIAELSKYANAFEYRDPIQIQTSDILEEYYLVTKKGGVNEKDYLGAYGKLINIVPEQEIVATSKLIRLPKKHVEKKGYKTFKIVSGPYASDKLYDMKFTPAKLRIMLDATNKIISTITVNTGTTGTPVYTTRSIGHSDVFYYDVQVEGVFGQVTRVTRVTDGDLLEIKLENGGMVTKKLSDVVSHGFKLKTQKEKTQLQTDLEMDVLDLGDPVEQGDPTDIDMDAEGGLDGPDAEGGSEDMDAEDGLEYVPEDVPEYKTTFNDMSRLAFSQVDLSTVEKYFRKEINKILKALVINPDSVNVNDLAVKIASVVSETRKNVFNLVDSRYITAAMVIDILGKIDTSPLFKKYFKTDSFVDLDTSLLATPEIKELVSRKKTLEAKKMLFERAKKMVNVTEKAPAVADVFVPGIKRVNTQEPELRQVVELPGNKTLSYYGNYETEAEMSRFDYNGGNLYNDTINSIEKTASKDPKNKRIYEWVKSNLLNGEAVLKKRDGSPKYVYFETVYNKFLKNVEILDRS